MLLNKSFNSKQALFAMFLALTSCFIFHSFFVNPDLPDFESYQTIYEIGATNFLEGSTGLVFVAFVRLCHELGLDYLEFRIALKLVSNTVVLAAMVLVFRRACNEYSAVYKNRVNSVAAFFVTLFVTYVFALEFFEIRIRAGLAISFALLSFSSFIYQPSRSLKPICWFGALVAAVIAFGVHEWTSMILLCILFMPVVVNIIHLIVGKKFSSGINVVFVSTAFLLFSVLLLYKVSTVGVSSRGEHLFSPLNPVRFAFLSIFTIIYGLLSLPRLSVYGVAKNVTSRINSYGPSEYNCRLSFLSKFKFFVFLHYFGFAMALSLFYFSGSLNGSGEAIVRISTLFMPVFLIGTLFGGKSVSRFFRLALVGNGLFFINTVFLHL